MSDTVLLSGKEFTASKKAAQLTGYAQDYIGQLARGGVIEAERVGGLWYVSIDSLNEYKRNADAYKPTLPERARQSTELDSVVAFDGKDYVSASRASKLSGYNQDYVGQLARAGKVLSRQIGNRWYVEREGLLVHKREKDGLLASVQAEAVGLRRPNSQQVTPSPRESLHEAHFRYVSESSRDLFPAMARNGVAASAQKPDVSSGVQRIAIRTVGTSGNVSRAQKERKLAYNEPRGEARKTMIRAAQSGVALTVIIMLSYGIVTLKDSGIYASLRTRGEGSLKSQSFTASAVGAAESLGATIERLIVPELLYER